MAYVKRIILWQSQTGENFWGENNAGRRVFWCPGGTNALSLNPASSVYPVGFSHDGTQIPARPISNRDWIDGGPDIRPNHIFGIPTRGAETLTIHWAGEVVSRLLIHSKMTAGGARSFGGSNIFGFAYGQPVTDDNLSWVKFPMVLTRSSEFALTAGSTWGNYGGATGGAGSGDAGNIVCGHQLYTASGGHQTIVHASNNPSRWSSKLCRASLLDQNLGSTSQRQVLAKHIYFMEEQTVNVLGAIESPAIVAAGTGYAVGESLTLLGGTLATFPNQSPAAPTVLQVTSVGGAGEITGIKGLEPGMYAVLPTNPVTLHLTTKAGVNATFNMTYPTVVAGGNNYAVGDYIQVSGGTLWAGSGVMNGTPTVLQVTAISGGGATGPVTQACVKFPGRYTVVPGNPVATTSTGAGTGATFNLTYQNSFNYSRFASPGDRLGFFVRVGWPRGTSSGTSNGASFETTGLTQAATTTHILPGPGDLHLDGCFDKVYFALHDQGGDFETITARVEYGANEATQLLIKGTLYAVLTSSTPFEERYYAQYRTI